MPAPPPVTCCRRRACPWPVTETRHPQAPSPSPANDDGSGSPDIRSLVFALAGTFVLRCASFCAGIMIPISLGLRSRTEHDVTVGLAGLVAVTFYASELLGAPIFGSLSDRFGRKLFMLLGPILGGVAVELMALAAMSGPGFQLMGVALLIPALVLVRTM